MPERVPSNGRAAQGEGSSNEAGTSDGGAAPDDAIASNGGGRADRPDPDALLPTGWRSQLRALTTVLSLGYQAAPLVFVGLVGAVVVGSLGGLITQTYALKLLTDAVLDGDESAAVTAAGLIAAGTILNMLVGRLHVNHLVKMSEQAQQQIDEQLIGLTSDLPGIEHHEWPQYADQLDLLRERRRLLGELPHALTLNLGALLPLIAGALLLATVHPALLLLPLLLVPGALLDRRAIDVDERAREATTELAREREHLFRRATTAGPGQEVRLFGLADELIERHDRAHGEYIALIDRANLRSSALRLGGAVIFAVGTVGAGGLALWMAMNGRASPGEVVLVVTVTRQVNGSVQAFAGLGIYLRFAAKQAARYLWLLDYSRDARRRLTPADPAPMPTALIEGVTIEHASFRYPGTDDEVLSDVSLHLPAGAVVALVGENGAGKTTLVKLLSRFYEPTVGHVLIDGVALTDFDPDAWHGAISIASQDFARFEFLAGEAVGVGDLPRIEERPVVHGAIERAGATGVMTSLPSGLDTQLGRTWPDGVELSGGEWQQLALGRAFMRPVPLLVIFDEPTAAIDAPTEHALFERFAEQSRRAANRGTVTLIVSHRFSTVRMADLIVVLEAGAVREVGSHAELMALDGLYAELYSLQARSYR